MRVISYSGMYSVSLCQKHPTALFVFGDNGLRVGKGGQAIIRDEPNAIGLATKRTTAHCMYDGYACDLETVARDMQRIEAIADNYDAIILPVFKETGGTTLGCGLADLPNTAPNLYTVIDTWSRRLIKEFSS